MQKKTQKLTYDQSLLLKKFIHYSKQISSFYLSLQANKRQLCEFLNSIKQYVIPFEELDLDKCGVIRQKDLQLFLIRNKYYFKPASINQYFQRYVHGKEHLSFEDLLEALLPHSEFKLFSTTLKKAQSFCNASHICHSSSRKVITNILGLIISQEIQFLQKDYYMMGNITDSSQQIGAILWRVLDRNHENQLTYEKYKAICDEHKMPFTKEQWEALINWHFRAHKKRLRRADFMEMCNIHNQNKRNRSACNYEHYVMKQQKKKACLSELERKQKSDKLIKQRIGMIGEMRRSSCQNFEQIVFSQPFPERITDYKVLLGSKIGYQNPKNLIKHSQLISE